MEQPPSYPDVARAEWHCAVATVRMLRTRQLTLVHDLAGSRLEFRDGSTSIVFRETAVRSPTDDPALLVVEFKLRLLGTNSVLHALFRTESWLNTTLFAGFDGFRSKLWLRTPATGVYRGVYEWDGADDAVAYAETLMRILGPVSHPGTVRYHVIPGTRRDDYIHHPLTIRGANPRPTAWWALVEPITVRGRGADRRRRGGR